MTTKPKAGRGGKGSSGATTSHEVASKAARVLNDEGATADERSVAASALAQVESADGEPSELHVLRTNVDELLNDLAVERLRSADLLSQLTTSQADVARLVGELTAAESRARDAEERARKADDQAAWHKRQRQ